MEHDPAENRWEVESYERYFDANAGGRQVMMGRSNIFGYSATAFVVALATFAVVAQHHGGPSAAAANFSELPPPPKMTGIGTATIKITTRSVDAQKYFDQGLNLLHAFWDMEAYRAFREASRSDPEAPMAWWGVYNSLAQNPQEMAAERTAALNKAVELLPKANDREQHYIRSIKLLAEQGKGRPAWISELEALISKYPDEVEAQLLLANALSTPASSYLPDGRPRDGKMYGRAILQNLLRTHPNHAAVHHYWIHAAENGPRAAEALESAEKLVKLAPNSGHMLHMPGHIYYRLGMYDKAREAFLASLAFDERYMRENKIHPINHWNYTHNLDYLIANSAEQGRYKEAEKYARMLAEVEGSNLRFQATGLGYLLYGGHTALTRLHMRFGNWDEAIASLSELAEASPAATYRRGMLGYLKGMKAVVANDAGAAEKALSLLQKAAEEVAAARSPNASDWYAGHAGRVLGVHVLDLRGSLASIRGEHDDAIKILSQAVTKERDLGYWEPPHYTRPVLESLGEAYIRAGKFSDAASAYERILASRPNSGFAFIGMARAHERSGDEAKAAVARKKLQAVWQSADNDLSLTKAASN